MSDKKFCINDVREIIAESDLELLGTKKLSVEISVLRPSDNKTASGLSPKFAVGMHFSARDEVNEMDESYDYPAYPDRLFTLDEITHMMKSFGIAPDERMWQITQDPNDERDGTHIVSDLSQVLRVED